MAVSVPVGAIDSGGALEVSATVTDTELGVLVAGVVESSLVG